MNLRQNTLDGFLRSSSPVQPENQAATEIATRGLKRKARKVKYTSDNDESDPSTIPGDEDESQSSDAGAIRFEPEVIDIDDDEERSPRRPTKKGQKMRIIDESDEQAQPNPDSSEEEGAGIPVAWKRKRSGKQKQVIADESESEEVRPRKRKFIRGMRPLSSPEDDADLLDEVDSDKIIESRFRTRDKKSTYQRNLEKLKRKKRGESVRSSSSSFDGEESDEPESFPHAKPDGDGSDAAVDDHASEDQEDAFIVEDDSSSVPQLPAQFSMNSHQDLIHHFKVICQYFVHLAVADAGERESTAQRLLKDEYFSVPLNTARRKISGMRDSLVASSVWRPEFKKPLETYPNLDIIMLDFAVPHCDACHLGGRMSTRLGRLSGSPYVDTTYETLEEGSTSESDDDTPPVRKEFNLGRFCAKRTQVFHKFTHWEYHIFRNLLREVDALRDPDGTQHFVIVAHASGVQPPEDLSDPDGIMEWLDERGVITGEWRNLKKMMDSARNLDVHSRGGENDSD
ncbi:hypothetical protein WOLCODRAFT_96408 [Wolfiporia cocos MD-104 SS10]|uniref:DUF4211 domain-containing protein n=1 Tax=Wolfiporia cocos (strain MD-104) TaxID=742152 RepID=A0A2H3JN37_WOLCO|nr:hypothetical protein WOLCODRAFT_96408 [Wolfiporia cocos MD-104 SS10]